MHHHILRTESNTTNKPNKKLTNSMIQTTRHTSANTLIKTTVSGFSPSSKYVQLKSYCMSVVVARIIFPFLESFYRFQGIAERVVCRFCSDAAEVSSGRRDSTPVRTTHNEHEVYSFDGEQINTQLLYVHIPLWRNQRGTWKRQRLNVTSFDCNAVILPQPDDDTVVTWKVASVICHTGPSVNSGHYVCWRRMPESSNVFVLLDDAKAPKTFVDYTNFSDIPSAYVMLLERN